jgi:hypothetical protein
MPLPETARGFSQEDGRIGRFLGLEESIKSSFLTFCLPVISHPVADFSQEDGRIGRFLGLEESIKSSFLTFRLPVNPSGFAVLTPRGVAVLR